MSDDSVIEEAAKAMLEESHGEGAWESREQMEEDLYLRRARAAFAVFEKAHTPTDDEREALHLIEQAESFRSQVGDDANPTSLVGLWLRTASALEAALGRSEAPEPQGEPSCCDAPGGPERCGDCPLDRKPAQGEPSVHDDGCEADWGSEGQESPCRCSERPQGEPSDAQALELDPQPWVFVSDQVFGVRSATDKGFHSVSGAYYVFQPRSGYEQDRARYEKGEST